MKKITRTCQTLCICCENSCAVQRRIEKTFFIESKFQVWGFTDIPCIYDNQCIFRSTGPFIKKNEELKNALIFLAYPNYWRTKYFFKGVLVRLFRITTPLHALQVATELLVIIIKTRLSLWPKRMVMEKFLNQRYGATEWYIQVWKTLLLYFFWITL